LTSLASGRRLLIAGTWKRQDVDSRALGGLWQNGRRHGWRPSPSPLVRSYTFFPVAAKVPGCFSLFGVIFCRPVYANAWHQIDAIIMTLIVTLQQTYINLFVCCSKPMISPHRTTCVFQDTHEPWFVCGELIHAAGHDDHLETVHGPRLPAIDSNCSTAFLAIIEAARHL
jgi:hypothetical protein